MSKVIWMTGYSGAGKTTIAHALKEHLEPCVVLDGDEFRTGISKDLAFSIADRTENIRRAAEMAKIIAANGVNVIAAFITPLEEQREMARRIIGAGFVLVHVSTPLETCVDRDAKGLYKHSMSGRISDMTGCGSAYEIPTDADVTVDTKHLPLELSVKSILSIY